MKVSLGQLDSGSEAVGLHGAGPPLIEYRIIVERDTVSGILRTYSWGSVLWPGAFCLGSGARYFV